MDIYLVKVIFSNMLYKHPSCMYKDNEYLSLIAEVILTTEPMHITYPGLEKLAISSFCPQIPL